MIHKQITDWIVDQLIRKGRFSIRGLGTFKVKPARKGMAFNNGTFKDVTHKWRVVFKCSDTLKQRLDKEI